MPPRADRNISYTAPQVPAFLQKLHAQVNGNRSGTSRSAVARPGEGDELDEMLAREGLAYSAEMEGAGQDAGAEADAEEIWESDGAQVVVLKEGRHLTAEEAERLRQEEKERVKEKESEKVSLQPQARIATGPSSSASKRKRMQPVGGDGKEDDVEGPSTLVAPAADSSDSKQTARKQDDLSAAKELIAADKKRRRDEAEEKEQETKKAGTKPEDAAKKKKEAAKAKKKSGKGLSFSFDD